MGAYEKINAMITGRLVARIEETGTLPWRKPWKSLNMMPRNLVTGKNYRGANVFILHGLGYSNPHFLSMLQANDLGAKVKKGERACPVVFWKIVDADDQDDPDAKTYAFLRYYRVFNVEQCEGLPEGKVPVIEVSKRNHDPIEAAEHVVSNMPNPPRIRHGCRQASYNSAFDTVSMPDPEVFHTDAAYYAALNHELAHSTGHGKRLARKAIMNPDGFGSHAYSREELVAEMTSAFLSGYTGILMTTESNQAAYLKGWLKRLKSDPTLLLKAGSEAQKAFDYIVGDRPAVEASRVQPVADVVAERMAA